MPKKISDKEWREFRLWARAFRNAMEREGYSDILTELQELADDYNARSNPILLVLEGRNPGREEI